MTCVCMWAGQGPCPCPNNPYWRGQERYTITPVQQGCVCPPTSEKTCENPHCPRQDPMKRSIK